MDSDCVGLGGETRDGLHLDVTVGFYSLFFDPAATSVILLELEVLIQGVSASTSTIAAAQGYSTLKSLFLFKKAHALVLCQRSSLGQAILIKELTKGVFKRLLLAWVVSSLLICNLNSVLNISWHG